MIDPTQAAGAGQQPGADAQQPISVVCIAAMPDGTYMVYPDNDEGDEGDDDTGGGDSGAYAAGGAGGDDDSQEMANGQPAKDIAGALKLAAQMLQSAATSGAAQMGAAPAKAKPSADDLFQQGFNQARGG